MISDRRGFEHVELGPERLPGSPSRYLDVPPAGDRLSHGFERIDAGSGTWLKYARYRRINPNDSESNRGAYVAVGFIAARSLPVHTAASCIDAVSQIFGHLTGFLRPDDRFESEFKLGNYAYRDDVADLVDTRCSPLLLLDVLLQGMRGHGALGWKPGRPIFIDSARLAEDGRLDSHLLYFKSGAAGRLLRFDRERERIGRLTHQLTVAANRADDLRREWLSYQSMINEHLPSIVERGAELRSLIEELEELNAAADLIPAARPRFALPGRADARDAAPRREMRDSLERRDGAAGIADRHSTADVAERRGDDAEGAPAQRGSIAARHGRHAPPGPFGRRTRYVQRTQRRFRPSARQMMIVGGALVFATLALLLALQPILDGSPTARAVTNPQASIEPPPGAPAVDSEPLDPPASAEPPARAPAVENEPLDPRASAQPPTGAPAVESEPLQSDAPDDAPVEPPPRDVARERAGLGAPTPDSN